MNLTMVEKIAKAVLYEGYMLYPYRPSSVKNQQRWNFGVLCPRSYSEAQKGSEAWTMQTECLVAGNAPSALEVRVRFLQLVSRSVGESLMPGRGSENISDFRLVPRLEIEGRVYQPWQEAVERGIIVPLCNIAALNRAPRSETFSFAASQHTEQLRDSSGRTGGVILRRGNALAGEICLSSESMKDGLYKVRVEVRNTTPFEAGTDTNREGALLHSMVSTHTVLGVEAGQFVSLLEPAEEIRESAASCQNVRTWPVLVGDDGQRDTMLSSPIILYDYPQIAPESPGDLFDGTEIDEILSLRILTLTDEEKREMSQSDERARQMLARTENMPTEHWMKLHGALRGLRPLKEEAQ